MHGSASFTVPTDHKVQGQTRLSIPDAWWIELDRTRDRTVASGNIVSIERATFCCAGLEFRTNRRLRDLCATTPCDPAARAEGQRPDQGDPLPDSRENTSSRP